MLEKIKQFHSHKQNFILALVTMTLFLLTPLYNTFSKNYINESLKDSALVYATLRTLNAGVSVIQESSVSVSVGIGGSIAIGQALDPINDAIERFSELITLSLWTLGAQKALFEVSNTPLIYYILALLVIVSFFTNTLFIKKVLMVLLILRLFIPFSALSSHYFNNQLFNPQIEASLQKIESYTQPPLQLHQNTTTSQWSFLGDAVENATETLTDFTNSVKFYITNSPKIISELLTLSLAYFSKYFFNLILLPFLFIYGVKALIEREKEVVKL